jgi:hypothetical protein
MDLFGFQNEILLGILTWRCSPSETNAHIKRLTKRYQSPVSPPYETRFKMKESIDGFPGIRRNCDLSQKIGKRHIGYRRSLNRRMKKKVWGDGFITHLHNLYNYTYSTAKRNFDYLVDGKMQLVSSPFEGKTSRFTPVPIRIFPWSPITLGWPWGFNWYISGWAWTFESLFMCTFR